jgi:hypothetical protein
VSYRRQDQRGTAKWGKRFHKTIIYNINELCVQ